MSRDPAKARAFLIRIGTHRENPEAGELELAPPFRDEDERQWTFHPLPPSDLRPAPLAAAAA